MKHLAALLLLALAASAASGADIDLGLGPQPVSAGKAGDTSKVNGTSLGTTAATAGTALIGTGSTIASVALSGDATIDGSGVVSLKATGTASTYTKVTTDAQGRVSSGTTLAASDIPVLAASKITTGQMALAQGGTNADLSATGGANQIVRQNSVGGPFTVSPLAAADIPSLDASKVTTGLLALARGGTNLDLSAAGNGKLLIGNGSGLTLANLTAGNGMAFTNAAGAITVSPKVFIIGADCTAHAVTGTTTETVLKAYSITAASMPITAGSLIVVNQLYTITGSTNQKQVRLRIGAAGAGTGGTITEQLLTTTAGNVTLARRWIIYCRTTSTQVWQNASSVGDGFSNNAVGTSAIDMTANWEIDIDGILTNTGETIQLEASNAEVYSP